MKKILLALLAACLCLAGCAGVPPAKAADGLDWSDGWVTVGGIVGVDTPEGLTSRENNDTLSANGLYYATWSAGEAVPYVNDDGNDVELYDAQLYLLLAGFNAAEKAEGAAAEWLAMAQEQYAVEETYTETYNGQGFTVITFTYVSETNPYARGAAAYGVYRNYAVSAELSCQEAFREDASAALARFLENCHYAT